MAEKRIFIPRIFMKWKPSHILPVFLLVGVMIILVMVWECSNVSNFATAPIELDVTQVELEMEWGREEVGKDDDQVYYGKEEDTRSDKSNIKKKVVIGAVSCRPKSVDHLPSNVLFSNYSQQTLIMIKSVIISAKLYNISTLEIHLFLEHKEEDEQFFVTELAEMGYPNNQEPEIVLLTHSAVDVVPVEYRDHMIYHPRYRCGYVRFFFPSALPEVDAIIHLDSDMLITGNIWTLWSQIIQFQSDELIGVARGNEANDTNYLTMQQNWFGDIPHPPPKGVNAGLLLMNLTRMREYDWETKFMRIYEDYSKRVILTGQRTVNVLLASDLRILKMLSCQFNFLPRHCGKGFSCRDAVMKGGGIHLVHGNGFTFQRGKSFHEVFMGYQQFNMSLLREHNNDYEGLVAAVRNHLMSRIRKRYNKRNGLGISKCFGTLNHVLFQDFFNDNNFDNMNLIMDDK